MAFIYYICVFRDNFICRIMDCDKLLSIHQEELLEKFGEYPEEIFEIDSWNDKTSVWGEIISHFAENTVFNRRCLYRKWNDDNGFRTAVTKKFRLPSPSFEIEENSDTNSDVIFKFQPNFTSSRLDDISDINESLAELNENETEHLYPTSDSSIHHDTIQFTGECKKGSKRANEDVANSIEEEIQQIYKIDRILRFPLSHEEWNSIKPEVNENTLQPHWTEMFHKKFEEVNPFCPVIFKFHKLKKENSRKSTGPLLKAYAKCKHSGCTEYIFMMHNWPEQDKSVEVFVERAGPVAHPLGQKRKRHMRGAIRKKYLQKLQVDKPSVLHYKLLGEMKEEVLDAGNLSHPQSIDVLKKVSSEGRRAEDLHRDPLLELIVERNIYKDEDDESHEILGYIQHLSIFPFTVQLFTEKQIDLCIELLSKGKCILNLDATGSIISNVIPEEKKRIYYYALVTGGNHNKSVTVPVAEMISNDHTVPSILHFLNKFKHALTKRKGKVANPKRIETDYSFPMINSVLLCFNNESIGKYLCRAWNVLNFTYTKKQLSSFTVLHLCASHMIKNFRNNISKIVIKDKGMAEFITYVFTLMQNSTSLAEVDSIFVSMNHVLVAKKMNQTAQNHLEELQRRIAQLDRTSSSYNHPNDHQFPDQVELDPTAVEGSTLRDISPFTKHFEEIKITTDANEHSSQETNPYYAPNVFLHIVQNFMHILPLWSGLLLDNIGRYASDCEVFQKPEETRATNAIVESWFRTVKHEVLSGRKKLKPGEFIRKMHVTIKGRLRSIQYKVKDAFKAKKENPDDMNHETEEETWTKRGKTSATKVPKYFSSPKSIPAPKKRKKASKPAKRSISESEGKNWNGLLNLENNCWLNSTIQALRGINLQQKLMNCKLF